MRGYDGGKKIKGRKRHIAVDSQGNLLGVQVTGADVSDAQGAYAVLDAVLGRYRSVRVVIADGAYDREDLLAWLLGKWEVGLDCVGRLGVGVLWCCRVVGWWSVVWGGGCWGTACRTRTGLCCYWEVLCEVEEAWIGLAGVRRLMRYLARDGS